MADVTAASSTAAAARAHGRRTWPVVALGTMCSSLPVFLTGALGVQLSDDIGLSATQIGLAMGASFTVAALLSAPMGRVAERLGPRRGFRVGLTTSALSMIAIATLARSFWQFAVFLGVAGMANAINQPSANLMLVTHVEPDRLGFALATKQSGMPAAALLGGAAVPAIALTAGWQWAYVAGVGVALLAIAGFPGDVGGRSGRNTSTTDSGARRSARPDLGVPLLVLYATVGMLGASSAGAMVGFITSGAEASGLDPGAAGLVLSLGSLVGIVSRLAQGWQVDRFGILPIQRLVWLYGLGARRRARSSRSTCRSPTCSRRFRRLRSGGRGPVCSTCRSCATTRPHRPQRRESARSVSSSVPPSGRRSVGSSSTTGAIDSCGCSARARCSSGHCSRCTCGLGSLQRTGPPDNRPAELDLYSRRHGSP